MNYTIAKGKLYFDTGTGLEYLGNTPTAELSIDSTMLDHFSSESGIKEKDDSALVEITRKLAITADDISVANWARFIVGAASTHTQAATPVVDESVGAVKQGKYYQVGKTTALPSGARGMGSVTVKVGASTKTITTDYTIDTALGLLYIVVGGGIADDAVVLVSYTPTANTRDQVISASSAATSGALRFIADNPKGSNRDVFMPSVNLKPTGTAKLKGENAEWMALGFEIEILKLNSSTAAIYIDGRPA